MVQMFIDVLDPAELLVGKLRRGDELQSCCTERQVGFQHPREPGKGRVQEVRLLLPYIRWISGGNHGEAVIADGYVNGLSLDVRERITAKLCTYDCSDKYEQLDSIAANNERIWQIFQNLQARQEDSAPREIKTPARPRADKEATSARPPMSLTSYHCSHHGPQLQT